MAHAVNRRDLERLVAMWRERAKMRRGEITVVDTPGRLVLVATAEIYEVAADELERSFSSEIAAVGK